MTNGSVSVGLLCLARDMASYEHHSGYPRYDGGHSQPEEECRHPDCVAIREAATSLPWSVAQLRHAYQQLKGGHVKDLDAFADGLLAPVIRRLEEITS